MKTLFAAILLTLSSICFSHEATWEVSYDSQTKAKLFCIKLNTLKVVAPGNYKCWAGNDLIVYDPVTEDTYILSDYNNHQTGTYDALVASSPWGTIIKKAPNDAFYLIIQGTNRQARSAIISEDGTLELIERKRGNKLLCKGFKQAESGSYLTCQYPDINEESKIISQLSDPKQI